MFTGEFTHVLDPKGRVSVPSDMRDVMRETYGDEELMVTKSLKGACLWAFPKKGWVEFSERLRATQGDTRASGNAERMIQMRRLLFTAARRCPVDKAGRVLIPEELRSWAKIEGSAVFCGNDQYIEIWSPDGWKAETEALDSSETKAAILAAVGHGF